MCLVVQDWPSMCDPYHQEEEEEEEEEAFLKAHRIFLVGTICTLPSVAQLRV